MSKPKKNHHLAATILVCADSHTAWTANPFLDGTDGQFAWTVHPLRAQAIKLKRSRVTAKERQFLLDIFAAFDANFPLDQIAGTTTELDPLQRRVALQCVKKGLGTLDGLHFSLSALGVAWLTIHHPELSFETMDMVPAYQAGFVQPSAPL